MRPMIAFAIAMLAWLWTPSALAMCGLPNDFISAADGSTLPENPTLYYFVPIWGNEPADARIRAKRLQFRSSQGKRVVAKTKVLPPTPAYSVFRIDLTVADGEEVAVYLFGDEPTYRYRIARSPKPSDSTVEVRSASATYDFWSCSYTQTADLTLSVDAPAYRIEWATSERAYRSGKRKAFVVPSARRTATKPGEPSAATEGSIKLGHHGCVGSSFEWKDQPIWIGIIALHADGTESKRPRDPVRVEPPPSRVPRPMPIRPRSAR